jgi:type VI secretion system protein ImpL
MKRFAAFFKNRFVLGFIGILALSLLIVFGLDYIKFGADNHTVATATRVLLIVLLFGIWLTHLITVQLLERRRNGQMLDELKSGAGAGAAAAGSGEDQRSREEQQLLSKRFSDAAQLLRKSRFKGASGSRALYQLPWYIIIGPPGAGKTTALINSGLEFPLAEAYGKGALGGVGGTRNCDWWFTNEAVLIDTAGRYTTQDSHRSADSSAWRNFLQLLKKYRPRQPINGAIVAVSLQDLLMQTGEQRAQQAKLIRARIDELQEQLGLHFPVYLLFTKCDLVAGFSEFFASLSAAEREQVWGVTFPADTPAVELADRFGGEYDALLKGLHDRTLGRVHAERDAGKRAAVQNYPLQMGSLKSALVEFLKQTFAANLYKDQPLLRGVYFCSGTQEGTPIDRMMAAVAANFRLGRDVGRAQGGSGKSFFLTRLFRDVIFAEAALVGVNRKAERLLRWGRRATYAGLALLLIAALGVWTGAVVRNNQFMAQVQAHLDQFRSAKQQLKPGDSDPAGLLPVLAPLREASTVYDQQAHPWLSGLGLYDGSVDSAADALYRNQLLTQFLPRLQHDMEKSLAALTARDAQLLPTLRAYLMLLDPQRRDAATITAWTGAHWSQTLPGAASAQEALQSHLGQLLAQPFGAVPGNQRVIAAAQQQLQQIPVAQRIYAQLRGGPEGQPVDMYSAIGGNTQMVFGVRSDDPRFSVPRLFTVAGYKSLDFSAASPLLRGIAKDRWLFGDSAAEDFSDADLERLGKDVRQLYLADYGNFWRAFLDGLHITRFGSLDGAVQALKQMTDPVNSPLLGVLKVSAEQTRLTQPLPAVAEKVAGNSAVAGLVPDSFKPTPVDKEFRELQQLVDDSKPPAPVGEVLGALRALHDQLAEISAAPSPGEAALNAAKARMNAGGGDPVRKLTLLAASQPAPVSTWLREVAKQGWGVSLGAAKGQLDSAWQQRVYAACERGIGNRFPLNPKAQAEVAMQDFNEYFKPGGIEASFVKEFLSGFIDTQNWRVRALDGQTVAISSETLAQLRRAQQIRSAFFTANPASASARFSLKPLKLDSAVRRFELDIGDTQMTYTHGPKIPVSLNWQGGDTRSVRFIFEDLNDAVHRKEYEGDWALFRMLSDAEVRGSGGSSYEIHISNGGRSADYQLSAASSINPFNLELLAGYRCPQHL